MVMAVAMHPPLAPKCLPGLISLEAVQRSPLKMDWFGPQRDLLVEQLPNYVHKPVDCRDVRLMEGPPEMQDWIEASVFVQQWVPSAGLGHNFFCISGD